MNTENKMKQIVIIAGVVIIFLLAAPYLYKVLLYGAGWVIWGFMAYFVGGVPLSDILSWWHIFSGVICWTGGISETEEQMNLIEKNKGNRDICMRKF